MALYNNVTGDDLKRQCTSVANEVERYMAISLINWIKNNANYLDTL